MDDYLYLTQQSEKHFKAYNKNNLDFIKLNLLPFSETYTAYTIYYFNQAYFEDNFEKRNNSINQLLYSIIFEQQPSDSEYLNHQIHIWIAVHQLAETPFETEEESYQTVSVFDLFLSESKHSTQTAIPELMANDPIAATTNQYDNKYKFQIVDRHQQMLEKKTPQFKTKFRTPILISKWCIELESRTQNPGKVVTEYAKAIRKLIKQKIYFFTKELKTDLSYALWPLLALKDYSTMNMTIELVQQIENNQRMHLKFTLPVFALVPPKQSEKINNPKDPNMNSILINPNNPLIKDNKIVAHLTINNNVSNQRPNHANINFFEKNSLAEATSKSASQPEKNLFYVFNLTNDDHDINELPINIFELTRKKKKAKVDFLESPEIVQKSGCQKSHGNPSSHHFWPIITHPQFRKNLCKSLIPKKKTPKTNKHSRQAELANNSNVTSLICKAQVADYFIDLILDSRSFVSIIAKHFLKAIGRKIDESSTRPMTNVHSDKKKSLSITKAVSVRINSISIETDMEVSKTKEYTIIFIMVKCHYWTTLPVPKQNQEKEQLNESNNDESNKEENQEEQKKTVKLAYTIFTNNSKPLNNVKTDKKRIMQNTVIGNMALVPSAGTINLYIPLVMNTIVKQKKSSPEEKKMVIENLLARNSPIISKKSDTSGQTHIIQHIITTKETRPIYLKPY
ncbi:hypothetical protein G9A89_001972 [Geosiphon pyriformis]|nr:hypothetical protein G9A89_001972 [Geosiphon pyriformis]